MKFKEFIYESNQHDLGGGIIGVADDRVTGRYTLYFNGLEIGKIEQNGFGPNDYSVKFRGQIIPQHKKSLSEIRNLAHEVVKVGATRWGR